MGHPILAPHASVALRLQGKLDRTLVVIAIAAALALAAVVPILANGADQVASTNRVIPAVQHQPQTPPGTRFDGGPDEGTRGIQPQTVAPGTRFDGGQDEGTRGPQSYSDASAQTSSSQPAPGPRVIPQGPGAR